ncbi:MAG: DHH family phosphoesterase, partial [Candidatus Nealsonbacteria bacterium]
MENNKNIIDLKDGDHYVGSVKIMRKTQPGPVIFTVSDGYGNVDAVIKDSNFKVDDVIEISGYVNERAGKLQIEVDNLRESKTDFGPVIEKNSEPINTKFSIESKRFEKLRPYFYKIAKRIRKAILENQPISIRHHADSDGINAGMAIEQSCKMFMEKIGVSPEYNLYRSPSRTPFYDINDVLRDVVLIKRIIEGHGQKKPLIIVLDNGSSCEDVFGLKALKSLGFEIIVIDHHNPVVIKNKKTLVDPYISLHLNPYIEGLDSQTCAGMLAYETARWICEDYSNPALPAVAGLSDRSVCEELDKYIKNSKKTNKTLESIGTAIDFVAYNLKFNAGKGLFETLYENQTLV